MIAVAVTGLVTEAMLYAVCAVAGCFCSLSAHPNPSSQRILPSLATATATEGTLPSLRESLICFRTGSNVPAS